MVVRLAEQTLVAELAEDLRESAIVEQRRTQPRAMLFLLERFAVSQGIGW